MSGSQLPPLRPQSETTTGIPTVQSVICYSYNMQRRAQVVLYSVMFHVNLYHRNHEDDDKNRTTIRDNKTDIFAITTSSSENV